MENVLVHASAQDKLTTHIKHSIISPLCLESLFILIVLKKIPQRCVGVEGLLRFKLKPEQSIIRPGAASMLRFFYFELRILC